MSSPGNAPEMDHTAHERAIFATRRLFGAAGPSFWPSAGVEAARRRPKSAQKRRQLCVGAGHWCSTMQKGGDTRSKHLELLFHRLQPADQLTGVTVGQRKWRGPPERTSQERGFLHVRVSHRPMSAVPRASRRVIQKTTPMVHRDQRGEPCPGRARRSSLRAGPRKGSCHTELRLSKDLG